MGLGMGVKDVQLVSTRVGCQGHRGQPHLGLGGGLAGVVEPPRDRVEAVRERRVYQDGTIATANLVHRHPVL